MTAGPRLFSILRQGAFLIASIHTALDDSQLLRFQEDLITMIGRDRARGVVIDVAALDVLDSFATSTLRDIGDMARLRGAATVVVGIQPDVAIAMVRLGLRTGVLETALDLEEGLALLGDRVAGSPAGRR
ncbi:RsbT antagonist protein rsbS [Modestobacter italicus]|uniref:RsbT antagonist protein rsbS n=1 Tax=Modestobacter italicus (strain DSM 44449 / CECT 9708 / BC 501) TaxID=2732864 RepID=I4EVE1_MODI5|nr:STAS domain-containing protein [Modestobacter marinus]CCH87354.1 RsbT antagonist protein rsbS [Modestobacter marinus]